MILYKTNQNYYQKFDYKSKLIDQMYQNYGICYSYFKFCL